jgi:hypothetical protein
MVNVKYKITLIFILLLFTGCALNPPSMENENQGYIIIHMEEQFSESGSVNNWQKITETIELAQEYNILLTVAWSPSWAQWFINNPEYLEEVLSWENLGHEFAIHHHGPSHAAWDGFTNRDSDKSRPGYKGDVEDMMNLLNQISNHQYTVYSGTDEESDLPQGMLINSNGGSPPSPDELLSTPQLETYGDTTLIRISKAPYNVGKGFDISLPEIFQTAPKQKSDQILGIVLNDDSSLQEQEKIESLFQALSNLDVQIVTASKLEIEL